MSAGDKKLSGGAKRKWLRDRFDEIKAYADNHGIDAAARAYDTAPETLRRLLLTDHGEYGHAEQPNYDMVSLRHQMDQVFYHLEKYQMWAASVNEGRRDEVRSIKEFTGRADILLEIAREQAAAFGAALGQAVCQMLLDTGHIQEVKALKAEHNDIMTISGKIVGRLESGLNIALPDGLDDITYNLSPKRVGQLLTELDELIAENKYPADNLGGAQPGTYAHSDHSREVPL